MFRKKLRQTLTDIFGFDTIHEKPVEFNDEKDCLYMNISNISKHFASGYVAYMISGTIGKNSENAQYGFFSRKFYNYDKKNHEKEFTLIGDEHPLNFGGGNAKQFIKSSQGFFYTTHLEFDTAPSKITIITINGKEKKI